MRFSFAGTKSDFLVNNGVSRSQSDIQTAIAPHVKTVRWTYTVPSNKRAQLGSAMCRCQIVTAGAGTPMVESGVEINGTSAIGIAALSGNSGVGSISNVAVPVNIDLAAGDAVTGFTQNGITGGTVSHRVDATLREYDA